jgi:hypothetical protein
MFDAVTATFEEPQVSEKREGEEWEQAEAGPNAGQFILKSCYPGSLLVNTTLETQECKVSRALSPLAASSRCPWVRWTASAVSTVTQAFHVTEFYAFDETKRKSCTSCAVLTGCLLQECEADSFAISFDMGCSDAAARPTVGWAGGCDSRYIVLIPEASCAPRFLHEPLVGCALWYASRVDTRGLDASH